jgi:hypothetical protein
MVWLPARMLKFSLATKALLLYLSTTIFQALLVGVF